VIRLVPVRLGTATLVRSLDREYYHAVALTRWFGQAAPRAYGLGDRRCRDVLSDVRDAHVFLSLLLLLIPSSISFFLCRQRKRNFFRIVQVVASDLQRQWLLWTSAAKSCVIHARVLHRAAAKRPVIIVLQHPSRPHRTSIVTCLPSANPSRCHEHLHDILHRDWQRSTWSRPDKVPSHHSRVGEESSSRLRALMFCKMTGLYWRPFHSPPAHSQSASPYFVRYRQSLTSCFFRRLGHHFHNLVPAVCRAASHHQGCRDRRHRKPTKIHYSDRAATPPLDRSRLAARRSIKRKLESPVSTVQD